jgi:hypothetical protein
MPSKTMKTLTNKEANKDGASGVTSQETVVVVSRSFMEILIGGPYMQGSEEHTYGHAALRVFVSNEREFVYDYGRYGKKSITGSEGDGILRVWTSAEKYIISENSYKRITEGYIYPLAVNEAEAIILYFESRLASAKFRKERKDGEGVFMREYQLLEDYHAVQSNCTTVTMSGAKRSGVNIVHHPTKYLSYRGLSWAERQAAKTYDLPEGGVFMPADLKAMLEGAKADSVPRAYGKKEIYGK